jgi:ATP-dependent Lon protease
VANLKKELKTYYECKLKNFDAEIQKDRLDSETSLNKILYRGIDQIDLPYPDKVKFLQLGKHEARFESLIQHLSEKTENSKGVISIEEKVRREINKSSKPVLFGNPTRAPPSIEKNELSERINNKKMPEHVRIEIEKEMKNMSSGSSKAVSQKYIETLLDIPWLESTEEVKDMALAEKILNEDHTGLKDVKERIL